MRAGSRPGSLESLKTKYTFPGYSAFFFFFGHASKLVGSQFPDQGLNLGHGCQLLLFHLDFIVLFRDNLCRVPRALERALPEDSYFSPN